jgi:hypothetical protein
MASEAVTTNDKCIVCKSDIAAEAKKCLKCNSRQDWLRFLDVGNTSISLLIAAVSVVALSADNIIKAIGYFSDSLKSSFTATLADVDPKQLSVFISNRGPGAAVFQGQALCSIWATEKAETLFVGENDKYYLSRYPKPGEVAGRYIYFYGDSGSATVIAPGQRQIFRLPFREIFVVGEKDLPRNQDEIKSYCTIDYKHENGNDDVLLRTVNSVNAVFFALDQPDVQAAIGSAARQKSK